MRKKTEYDVSVDLLRLKGAFHFKSEHHPYTVVKQDDGVVWDEEDLEQTGSLVNETKAVGLWGSFWIGVASSGFCAGVGYIANLIWPFIK